MGQINNYPVESVNATDRILTSDGVTGVTKNITPEGIVDYLGSNYYNCLLNQASTAAPVATVLGSNTIGAIVWARTSAGIYTGTLLNAFVGDSLLIVATPTNVLHTFSIIKTSSNVITLKSYLSGTLSDDILINQGLKIQVY
jgi:hypothetical protein